MSVKTLLERPARPALKEVPRPYRGGSEVYDLKRDQGRENRRIRRGKPNIKPYDTPGRARPPREWPGGLPPLPDGSPRRKPDAEQRRLRAFVRAEFGKPQFGRNVRRLFRRLPQSRIFDLIDLIEYLTDREIGQSPEIQVNPAAGWILKGNCSTVPDSRLAKQLSFSAVTPTQNAYHASANSCTGGQAVGSWLDYGSAIASNHRVLQIATYNETSQRGTIARSYYRPNTGVPSVPHFLQPSWAMERDPNMTRYAPGVAVAPEVSPRAETDTGSSWAVPPGSAQRVYSDGAGGRGPRTLQASRHRRVPPASGTRESKYVPKGKAARAGVLMYQVLDHLSEGAEMVDAIYQALPDDVKKRWERDRRPGDTFGQYGIEGADWKLQALYYNWHKVDSEQAVKNLIKNHLSDKIIGAYQKSLPRNAGNAHSHGEKEFAKWLDRLLSDELGL